MPKSKSISANERLALLEKARDRIVAADDLETLSAQPMADMLGVSWPTLRAWTRLPDIAASDAFVVGSHGIEWEFKPLATVDALLAHFRGELAKRQNANRRMVEATGIEVADDDAGQLDLADLQRQMQLTIMVQEAKTKQERLVRAETITDFMRGYNQATIEAVMGVGAKIDPTGALPAAVRAEMTEALRNVAVEINSKCRDFIGRFGARPIETGDPRGM